MAKRIVDSLILEDLLILDMSREDLLGEIEAVILDELSTEDRINDDVRLMLTKFEGDIKRGKLDYRKLFDITKQKLVRERGIIL